MGRRSSASWLALIYALLVVYASLYPFWPWRWPTGVSGPGVLVLHWPRYWLGFDIWANALGYAPFGLEQGSKLIGHGIAIPHCRSRPSSPTTAAGRRSVWSTTWTASSS